MDEVDRSQTTIRPLEAHSPELKLTTLWRHEAYLKDDGYSLADSEAQLTKLTTAPGGPQTAHRSRQRAPCRHLSSGPA
jgi:hypothetical protein